jgi:hypothetical protein
MILWLPVLLMHVSQLYFAGGGVHEQDSVTLMTCLAP